MGFGRLGWIFFAVAAASLQSAGVQARDACGLPAAVVDIGYDDLGRPVVPVRIGETDTTMLLDTGGAMTALEMDFVMDIDLPQTYAGFTMTAVTGETSWLMTTAPSFVLDTIAQSEIELMILPGYEYQLSVDEPVGILALDLLADYDLIFDFERDRFQARPPEDCAQDTRERAGASMEEGSLIDRRSDFLSILIVLDGMGLNAIVDTGAAYSVVNGDIASERLGIDLSQPDEHMTEVDNVDGIPIYARQFSRLVIGGMVLSDPSLTLFPNFIRETGRTTPEGGRMSLPQAIIGMDILRGHQLHVSAGANSARITGPE